MQPKYRTPDKPGIYRTYWDMGQYVSFFDGTHWCNGAGYERSVEDFRKQIALELFDPEFRSYTLPYRGCMKLLRWELLEEWS